MRRLVDSYPVCTYIHACSLYSEELTSTTPLTDVPNSIDKRQRLSGESYACYFKQITQRRGWPLYLETCDPMLLCRQDSEKCAGVVKTDPHTLIKFKEWCE